MKRGAEEEQQSWQPRQVQWPPNCAGKCHTRGSRTCQSTPVPDGREGEKEGGRAGPLRPPLHVVHFVCNSFSFRFYWLYVLLSLSFFFGFRKVAARFMSSATFAVLPPHPLPTPLLIFIFSVFVSLLNGCR